MDKNMPGHDGRKVREIKAAVALKIRIRGLCWLREHRSSQWKEMKSVGCHVIRVTAISAAEFCMEMRESRCACGR